MNERQPGAGTFRVTCPHNCYDTCGMIVTVEGGIVRRIEGDPDHPHSAGRLCAKGYSYVDRVYATDRLRHPMLQSPKGSGQWRRMTWDEALSRIADKLLDVYDRHGSLLPVCLYRGSGNLGVLHEAPDAMFRAMGPHTVAVNQLCMAAGAAAQAYDFGGMATSDPRQMLQSKTLLLWGVNPAWTAPHQMNLIMQAQDQGTSVIVIDPVATATASRADLHVAPRPATDGALALGMARCILDEGLYDQAFLADHVKGWDEFAAYLRRDISLEWAAAETGLPPEAIREIALAYATGGPAMIWVGYGMQRHANGGQSVRAIDALAAMTGQVGRPGTGVQYGQMNTWVFGNHLRSYRGASGRPYTGPDAVDGNRTVTMGAIGQTLPAFADPPVEVLWVTGGNPARQEPDSLSVRRLLRDLDLVVVVDQFMTDTAREADIVLPTTTHLGNWDLHASYWHHYISLTERAVVPPFEARSDLSIAWALSAKLAELRPGFCVFPTEGDEQDWVERELKAGGFDVGTVETLRRGPVRAPIPEVAWESLRFATPSGRIELASDVAEADGLPRLPVYMGTPLAPGEYPLRLLTPHPAESLHSQFHVRSWNLRNSPTPLAEVHPELASRLGLSDGDLARIYNDRGELRLPVRVTRNVPPDTVVAYEAFYPDQAYSVNDLTAPASEGDGAFPGVAYGDCFVAVAPLDRRE
ncbi:MAG TPA: molybdopterin-dependent oxidoreductase [Symbiobacteriaceae bacterium]|nr:molybdopterin-dependent oxidoreductase [Symbiobacteriaceae bacterium]